MIRFVHISDTHIGPDPDYILYGRVTLYHARRTVDYINHQLPFEPDFVLHTGDVTYNPDPVASRLAAESLSELQYPVYYVRGNHDDPEAMRAVLPNLPAGTGRINYDFRLNDFHFIVLDTFGHEQPSGYLELDQLIWLQSVCERTTAPSLVLVVHHLPVLTGNPWLDARMIIKNHDALFDVLRPFQARIRGLFYGHIHDPSTAIRDGITCSSVSATFSRFIYPNSAEGGPIHTAPGGFSVVTMTHEQTWILHYQVPDGD